MPDVALIDMRMPVMSGVEAAAAIRDKFPGSRMIALTTYEGDENVRRAFAAGVRPYLTKDVRHDELLRTIRLVHAGETCIPAALLNHPASELSAREIEVLELVVAGLSNKQITWRLQIADTTAKNHVKNILAKIERAGQDPGSDGRHSARHCHDALNGLSAKNETSRLIAGAHESRTNDDCLVFRTSLMSLKWHFCHSRRRQVATKGTITG